MNAIEITTTLAFKNQYNVAKGNTTVTTDPLHDTVTLYQLHGNTIATYNSKSGKLTLHDAGWKTNTTKSRLNSILDTMAPGYGISQRKGEWYITRISANGAKLNEWPWSGNAEFKVNTKYGNGALTRAS